MSSPVAMNRAERRKQGRGKQTVENAVCQVRLLKRVERKLDDGSVVAVCYFTFVTANGAPIVEDDTPDGPLPVMFKTEPVLIKKATGILTGPTLVTS